MSVPREEEACHCHSIELNSCLDLRFAWKRQSQILERRSNMKTWDAMATQITLHRSVDSLYCVCVRPSAGVIGDHARLYLATDNVSMSASVPCPLPWPVWCLVCIWQFTHYNKHNYTRKQYSEKKIYRRSKKTVILGRKGH